MASAAGAIRAQWNGALTGSIRLRRAPRPAAISTARATAARWPLTTTCPGALSLAQAHTWSPAASSATAWAAPRSSPIKAAMAPSPAATACCMLRPRSRNNRAVSATLNARAAASAEYSPTEWPATKAVSATSIPASASSTRITARLTAMIAGWAFSVSISWSSGPSNISRLRFCFRASSTSCNRWRAAGKASASARPIPTDCDP